MATIDDLTRTNEITIKFSEPMTEIELTDSVAMNLTLSGPMAPYVFTSTAAFEDEYTLTINITMVSIMAGDDEDKYLIEFDTDLFLSIYNANLLTKSLYGYLYKIPIIPDVIAVIGNTADIVMKTTLIALISSNILLGQSSELMWGFMNTMQIMLFFPVLKLYFPDHLAKLLTYFSSARMQIDIPMIEVIKTDIETKYNFEQMVDMEALNERWESIEYESTSVLLNADEVFMTFFQNFVICVIVYGVRALIFTLNNGVGGYEEQLRELENNENDIKNNFERSATNTPSSGLASEPPQNRKEKMKLWGKNKIKSMSGEYKYNFFIRIGLELFLEVFVLSLLNIRYIKFESGWQYLSTIVASLLLLCLITFFVWTTKFSCSAFAHLYNHQQFYALLGEYKNENLPQVMFNTYFMLRRMLYAFIIVFLSEYPTSQAFCFMIICLPILAYHLVMNPYKETVINVMMNINESMLVTIGVFFFIFAEPDTNTDRVMLLGWAVIGLVILVMIFNVLVLWIQKIILIVSDCKKNRRQKKMLKVTKLEPRRQSDRSKLPHQNVLLTP